MNFIMITLKKYVNKSRLSLTDTDSLMYEMDVYEHFSNDKEIFDFSNYSVKSKYYDNLNKLEVGRMKDKTAVVAIEEFVGLKPTMCLYFVDDNSEHKKAKGVNKNVAGTLSHNEYKDDLLNKKCLRHSMSGIQGKDQKIGTCQINKISLSSLDDKIYIQNNRYDGLAIKL